MTDAALSAIVLALIVIAISVDVAALLGWLKAAMNRKESEHDA
jgi:ABC-type sulfate transport system permease subunit